jgi:hypothetical protein
MLLAMRNFDAARQVADRSKLGVTQRALRAGSLAKPKGVRDEDFEEFINAP